MAERDTRIIAQRITTGEFLDWDLPLNAAESTRALSGPGGINGTVEPELARSIASDGLPLLDQWSTALYKETDGLIRGGAIVTDVSTQGPARTVTSAGFCGYPTGIPYDGEYAPGDFEDPLDTFRNIWAYVQSYPNSKLGLTVSPDAHSWMLLSSGEGPYRMSWFENRDCGSELESIAMAAPFDYLETHEWADAARTQISHRLDLGFPRLGRQRDDLLFEGGMNVSNIEPIVTGRDRFANAALLLGPGEGRAKLRASASVSDGRLRRVAVVSYLLANQGFLDKQASKEVAVRAGLADIAGFVVSDHPSAPLSAIQPGDDVRLRAELPWFGEIDVWLRVLEIVESVDRPGEATLKTTRSEFIQYAPAASPTGDKQVIYL